MMKCAATRTRVVWALLAAGAALLAGACRDANRDATLDEQAEPLVDDRPEATTDVADAYAPQLNVDLSRMTRAESGLYYQDLEIGEGEVATLGRHVEVHYTTWQPDGTMLASSLESGETEEFVLGTGAVIIGWEEGMVGMREGGRRRLVIPPALAYGRDGYGAVPPYATLVIDVELVRLQ